MRKCLLTQLESQVSGDLVKLNELRLNVHTGGGNILMANGETVRGIGVTVNGQDEWSAPSGGWNNVVIAGDGQISLMNKYRGTYENPGLGLNLPMDYQCVDQLKYTNLRAFNMIGYPGPQVRDNLGEGITLKYIADNLPNCVVQFQFCGKYLSGSISDLFAFKDSLTAFGYGYTYNQAANTLVTGSFADLGHFYKATNYFKTLEYFTNISGSVESFVAAKLAEVPATAGSATFNELGLGDRITYNGTPVTSGITTIAWDAQGNITLS